MIALFIGIFTAGLFLLVLILVLIDKRKIRKSASKKPISVVVPCYNDAASIEKTIKSIYAIINPLEVIVINDASTDESLKILETLQEHHPFTLINNPFNMGKPPSLNKYIELAKNETLLLIDSDIIVNKLAFEDAINRLDDPLVGAVSCPYTSKETHFLARMQSIEYYLLSLVIGSLNHNSTLAIWGGFLAIKKSAFLSCGKFSLNAINDDMDLAAKLNKKGWIVEQSFFSVENHVPDTLRIWFKQKLRWNSGAIQCSMMHSSLWMKKPLFSLFLYSFNLFFILLGVLIIIHLFIAIHTPAFFEAYPGLMSLLGIELFNPEMGVLKLTIFSLIGLPALFSQITSLQKLPRILLLFPFAFLYIPLISLISLLSAIDFFSKRKKLKNSTRTW